MLNCLGGTPLEVDAYSVDRSNAKLLLAENTVQSINELFWSGVSNRSLWVAVSGSSISPFKRSAVFS
jgi:hypothetical protein